MVHQQQVLFGLQVGVRCFLFLKGNHFVQCCFGFYGECIAGQVRDFQRQGFPDIGFPCLGIQPRGTKDQVDAVIGKSCYFNILDGLFLPVERSENGSSIQGLFP